MGLKIITAFLTILIMADFVFLLYALKKGNDLSKKAKLVSLILLVVLGTAVIACTFRLRTSVDGITPDSQEETTESNYEASGGIIEDSKDNAVGGEDMRPDKIEDDKVKEDKIQDIGSGNTLKIIGDDVDEGRAEITDPIPNKEVTK